jgi:hypothetical protein
LERVDALGLFEGLAHEDEIILAVVHQENGLLFVHKSPDG